MNGPEQEAQLIRAARNGDRRAFAVLYKTHVQRVYRYVILRVKDPALSEDITSDVFVRAIETIDRYEKRGIPFLGWLYHIAHGRIVDHYRRRSRRPEPQSLDEVTLLADSNPEHTAFQNIRQEQLLERVKTLTADQQQVVMLRFLQGYNLNETAKLMGKTIGAIKALQLRALRSLARSFEKDVQGDGDDK